MPSIHSHGNTNVSKIWFVVLFWFVMMVTIAVKLYQTVEEIALSSETLNAQVNELLSDHHCTGTSC